METIAKLTLREKADLLTGKAFFKTRDYPEYGIREMYLSDGPHGLRKQAEAADHLGLHKSIPATCFPTASLMACSWDEALGERLGAALGREAGAQGVDMVLGPGLNIKRSPLCGRNFEYFSEDPFLAGKLAAAYVRGIQSQNVSACVKHFAANNREYRRMTADSVVDERTLREIYLTGFEIAVKEGGANAVMTSYNRLNGTYTNENPHLIQDILRGEWGFEGAVVTDWGGSNSRVAGLKCGNDLEMPACGYGADDLVRAVEEGEIPESLLDESVARVLALAEFSAGKNAEPFDEEAHHALARECAARSMVLLENDGTLPLNGTEKVALIGDFAFTPRYQGAGSSVVNPTKLSNPERALRAAGVNVIAAERGFHRYGKKRRKLYRRALKAAAKSDVVLFFAGLDEYSEAEGLDRTHIRIPENQKTLYRALIAAGRKVVVVLSAGAVVETDWTAGAAAVLYAGLAGQAGAEAIADVLCGTVNPAGKLAETWVEKYGDEPTAENFPGGRDVTEYREGLFVGYRYFKTAGVKSRYPFGYGKSYTTFEYSDIKATREGVTFTVTNTGARAGDEIAQVYIARPHSRIIRPAVELKGFCRVALKAGESKEIFVPFNDRTFAHYDTARGAWTVEKGEFEVRVGASSEDVRLTAIIESEGTMSEDERAEFPHYAACMRVPDEEYYRLLGYVPQTQELKRRTEVTENTTIGDLKYARGWSGRLFAGGIRAAIGVFRLLGRKETVNTLTTGALSLPIRGLAKFGGMTRQRMEGLITMFNGKFFKGIKMFFQRSNV